MTKREGWLICYENSETHEFEHFVQIYGTFEEAMKVAREACDAWDDTSSSTWQKVHSFGGDDKAGIISRAHHHYGVNKVILP